LRDPRRFVTEKVVKEAAVGLIAGHDSINLLVGDRFLLCQTDLSDRRADAHKSDATGWNQLAAQPASSLG